MPPGAGCPAPCIREASRGGKLRIGMPLGAEAHTLIGAVLEDRFRIEGLLGEGGMGRVYSATELLLRRRCAVKVLLPEFAQDKDSVARFLREARAIAQIRHESVVEIYHLGGDASSGVVFFAMEFLSGEDLEARFAARAARPLAWQEVCQWMAQVAGAVEAVHNAGMIHRDLKPSNIFLHQGSGGRSRIKLLDFGIARLADQSALTMTGAAFGTPQYMSPEQIFAEPLDHRTDIYSFGVLLYEALAGRVPFDGEPLQVAMQHRNVAPPPIGSAVPPELETFILRLLAKDRTARPQTMAEIEQTLLAFVSSPAVAPGSTNASAAREHAPVAATRHASRMSVLAFGGVAVALALVLVLIRGFGGDERDAPSPPPAPADQATPLPVALAPPAHPPESGLPESEAPADVAAPSAPQDVLPPPTPTAEPKNRNTAGPKPELADPLRQLAKAAAACRKTHRAPKEPKITIDYATGRSGTVTRAVPAVDSPLGRCLADAVKKTKFRPELRLGLRLDL